MRTMVLRSVYSAIWITLLHALHKHFALSLHSVSLLISSHNNFFPPEVLGSKKKTYSELAKDVNNIKVAIDQTRRKLEELRQGREEEGRPICLETYLFSIL